MRNPTGKKLEKILFKLFDEMIEDIEQYNHNGSLWIIFTNERQWVVEYTEGGTLWYNYKLFKNEMELVGMDCVENKEYITRWFEDRFLNKPKVKNTDTTDYNTLYVVEDTIQNGVRHTHAQRFNDFVGVEDTIQNGVKDTAPALAKLDTYVEDTIENGVKLTVGERMNRDYSVKDIVENGIKNTYSDILPQEYDWSDQFDVEETIQNGVKYAFPFAGKPFDEVNGIIQNGVKECNWRRVDNFPDFENRVIKNSVKETKENRLFRTIHVMNTIKNGVKHVEDGDWLDQDERVDDIIENGVKETKEISNISLMSEIFKVNSNRAIKDGVKELKELPDKSGELRGYGDWYHRQGNMTKPHTEYVKEIIEDSYNHMGRVEGVIRNTDKDGI